MIEFTLRDESIELNKLLKATGLVESGGEAKQAIQDGLVRVDGAVETRVRCQVRAGSRVIYGRGEVRVRGAS